MKSEKPHKNPFLITLKVVCWVVGVLVIIAGAIIWGISAYLRPDNIVKLIEEKSAEYLDAEIKIGKLDYRLWHNYPWLQFEVDSLQVISKSLDNIPDQQLKQLPAYSDSLASLIRLCGEINVHALFKDKIELRNLYIEKPSVNIVMVNDSSTNYNILKTELPKNTKIPKIDISEIRVESPVDLSFFALDRAIEGALDIENFYLIKETDKTYKIGFDGIAKGRYQEFALINDIPVKFTTEISPSLPDLAVTLNNFSIVYGGLKLDLSGDIKANQNGVDLKDINLNFAIDDIFTFIKYLPPTVLDKIQLPEGITGVIPLKVTARLLSPYQISKEKYQDFSFRDLPLFSAVVNISDANLNLTPPKGKRIEADDIYLIMECNFDPNDSEQTTLSIAELRMRGEGISLEGVAHVANLTGEKQTFDGNVNFESPLMESLSYFVPRSSVKVSGYLKGDVQFSGNALELGQKGFSDLTLSGNLLSHSLKVNSNKSGNVKMKNMKTDFRGKIPSYPLSNYTGTKLGFDFTADSILAVSNGTNLLLSKLQVNLSAADTVAGSPDPYGTLTVKAKSINALADANRFNADNLTLKARGTLNSKGAGNYSEIAATKGGNDELIASRINHTPLVVEYDGGGILQTIMGMVDLDADIRIEKGNFKTPLYLYPIQFSGVDLNTNLNKLTLSTRKIQLANTGVSLWAEMEGIEPFMTTFSATPLNISADINFSNVDINELSWGYYGAQISQGISPDSVFYVPNMLPLTAADSVCVAIPRNIDANIRLFSDGAQYMQYKFSPLSTDIVVKDGEATLRKLTIGAPYCTAIVDWTYSTSRLDNIYMDLKAQVNDFEFSKFYPVFPQLIDKAPELKDFTGEINANIGCRFDMFPDMFMNPESLQSRFDIKGSHLQFARQGKIEKITHLMLIEGDGPIHIDNINITGAFHDNLLQVNPFKIRFEDYQLGFAGINNLAGDIYYHLALEKSPFHVPFGVTLRGKLKHPDVRVGGTHINDNEAEVVSRDLSSHVNANIMAYLRHGWLLFVQEAAKYQQLNLKDESGK